jgi:excisionase family DNA binding protein
VRADAPNKMLSAGREAAAALSISLRTLESLTASREIACVRIGRAVRYDIDDLAGFIAERKVPAAKQ